ncbi:MAG: homocysteine S-methyltransferase family protein [Kofleriaceae bacterium]|nr:homocysteine S-methyltransferase family protein [Kofleriaceae bacterium]
MSQPLSDLSTLPAQLVLDGGCGTFLIARGLDVRAESTAAWNLSHQQEVLALHQSFVDAGAGAIQTNTFAANSFALAPHKVDVRECNLAAVALAKQAVGERDVRSLAISGPPDKFRLRRAMAISLIWKTALQSRPHS